MKLVTARVPAHAVADLTAQERDVMQDILRKRAARDLPVTFEGGALEVSVLPCTPAQHQALAAQTLARVRPGSVILLHDGPAVTPALLGALLAGLGERGLEVVPMHELPARRITLREGWTRLRASYGA